MKVLRINTKSDDHMRNTLHIVDDDDYLASSQASDN